MNIKDQINQDLKQAMLAGEKTLTTTLRGLKSAILNVEIAKGVREQGLSEPEVTEILSKEAKKRQESADLYKQGGNEESAKAELIEKQVIEKYLPAQLSEDDLKKIIEDTAGEISASGMQDMGKLIGAVKQKTAGQADGALIASLVKEKLSQ